MEMAGPTSRTPPVGLRPRHGGGLPSPVAAPVTRAVVDYPSSDGKPMAESDAQRAAIIYAIDALETWFSERRDVYVSGDLLIYYEEGNVSARIAPDAFVAFGVEKRERMTYLLWEERTVPEFVLEVASKGTWREDVGRKRAVYERLGVSEYWQYDPTDEYLTRKLLYSRLRGGIYEEQTIPRAADGSLRQRSEVLGLELRAVPGGQLRFHDPVTGKDLLSHKEAVARAEREAAARRAEAAARQSAEARVAELEALIRERG